MSGTEPLSRLAGALAVLGALAAGAVVVAGGPQAPEPLVDRASYGAGRSFAAEHQRDPRPSGLPAGVDGTNAACRIWFDAERRDLDRADFLAGCWDQTNGAQDR